MYFDQRKTIGALGTLIAAKWYRTHNPHNLLISLDSADARRWMNFDSDGKRADLLGLCITDGKLFVDILEVKAGEDARDVYVTGPNETITGKPVAQLVNTQRSIAAIFGQNELKDHILTPPRREILRNHFYRQGFSGDRSPRDKQVWGDHLNTLFSGEVAPVIRMNLIVVNFGINSEAVDSTLSVGELPVRVIHLNETAVGVHLSGRTESQPEKQEFKRVFEIATSDSAVSKGKRRDAAKEPRVERSETAQTPVPAPTTPDLLESIRTTCVRLKAACEDYQIRVSEIDPDIVDIGPSVLRYKIQLAPGEQGEKLRRQAENIARQLAAESIPVVDRLPGTNLMYLDMARPDRQTVVLDQFLFDHNIAEVNELPLHVGMDPAGKTLRLDLGDDRLPHILVAGGTGSGKTIFLYSVVLSLTAAHSEKTLELAIIDPKQTDFAKFGVLPHLRSGRVVTDASEGVQLLRTIADVDMLERSRLFQESRHRDIKAYNLANPLNVIRPLVVIIDEYADLVAVLPKREREQFDLIVSRLAARGRNVGIHLIIATQRPTADVITGNIKANMPCRISFSLPSGRDSQVILDEPGAERLLRKGDMLLMFEGQLTRLQGYFTNPDELDQLLERVIHSPKPLYGAM
jgi:FtsK/SpoIIIE family/FtsK alpha domain